MSHEAPRTGGFAAEVAADMQVKLKSFVSGLGIPFVGSVVVKVAV